MMVADVGGVLIGGIWCGQGNRELIDVVNPATEETLGRVLAGTPDDAAAAVDAATRAFAQWSTTRLEDRIAAVRQLRELLAARAQELAEWISADVGTPITLSRSGQVGLPLNMLDEFVAGAHQVEWRRDLGTTLVVREPIGVVAAITPWNFPLQQGVAKLAPALIAGCTVVLKPSEIAPFASVMLAEALEQAGLPSGAVNLVTGYGDVVGEALIGHPGVAMISFTGSTPIGRRIAEVAARSVKKVTLELGGKSPSVVLPDADIEAAVRATAIRCFNNSGQTCAALTRLLVPAHQLERAEAAAAETAEAQILGDPLDPETTQGPLVSARQREVVREYIDSGVAEGARLIAGGLRAPVPARGFYVAPTVFSDVTPAMRIAREEIFGPVLSIIGYHSIDEAIELANDTAFGLNASVWAGDAADAARVAARLRSGQVNVNGGRPHPGAPFGGYKESGLGRENGRDGITEFLQLKSVNFGRDLVSWPDI
jgi:acyl-CoA reductase-like NAD-dependent aldehyde dehydrogenase